MGQIKVEKNVGGIEGLCVIEPAVHGDARGYFMETYNERDMKEAGIDHIRIVSLYICTVTRQFINRFPFGICPVGITGLDLIFCTPCLQIKINIDRFNVCCRCGKIDHQPLWIVTVCTHITGRPSSGV